MMKSKDSIGIAIQAGMVAKSVLQLLGTGSKYMAQMVVKETVDQMAKLAEMVDKAEENPK